MNRSSKVVLISFSLTMFIACGKKRVNIEKVFVDQVVTEFTEERLSHYLHGGAPKTNAEIMEKVLSRHSLKLIEFRPAFRRFSPEIEARLLGKS